MIALLRRVSLAAVLVLAATMLSWPHAFAAQRTFVHSSPFGNDANTASNCSLTAPCRSFNAAISVTDPGGEVVILDTAGYGPMTIGKSIKIIGPSGVYGGISAITPGTDGITINAGDNDIVTLRGLDVTGLGGRNDVNIVNAKAVHVEKSTVSGFADAAGACVRLDSAKGMRVFVNDSFLRDCQVGALVNGSATSARPRLVLDNTRIERGTGVNTDVGVIATNNVDLSIRNSVISSVGYGLRFENTLSGVHPIATLLNTSLDGVNNAIVMTNSGDGQPVEPRDHRLRVREPDVRDRRVTATNAGSALVYLTDSKVSRYTTGIKTGGAAGSWVQVFLLRSQLQQGNAALEHHLGRVVLNASHVVWNSNSLVDADSNDVRSLNNNMIFQNADSTAGTTYITTPALISTK